MAITEAQFRRAQRLLVQHVKAVAGSFKIGRLVAEDLPRLAQREEYDKYEFEAEAIFRGSPIAVSDMEIELTAFALEEYPKRCDNQRLGGGPIGRGREHVVYLVLGGPGARRRSPQLSAAEQGKLWFGLKRAWGGFKGARAQGELADQRMWAGVVNNFQEKLGLGVTEFDL